MGLARAVVQMRAYLPREAGKAQEAHKRMAARMAAAGEHVQPTLAAALAVADRMEADLSAASLTIERHCTSTSCTPILSFLFGVKVGPARVYCALCSPRIGATSTRLNAASFHLSLMDEILRVSCVFHRQQG